MARRFLLPRLTVLGAAAAVSLSILSTHLTLPATALAQVVPPPVENSRNSAECVVNTDNIYVRSGAGDNYYPTMKLAKGTKVTVIGEKFDWLKIAPPAGSFSYVGKHFIEKTAEGVGRVNRENVNVRAGSELTSIKTTVQAQLSPGAEVKILDEVEEYYKITPPADAAVYVKKDFVDVVRVVPQVASNTAGAPEPRTADATPVPTNPIADTATTPDATIATTPIATTDAQLGQKSPTAGAPATQPAPTATAEVKFDKLEAEFETVSAKPIEQQPVAEMLKGYETLVKDPQLPESMRRVADYRAQILKARAEARDQFVAMQKQQEETKKKIQAYKSEQEEIAQQIQKTEVKIYTAVGTLRTSSIQQGNGMLYRLTDPQNGRTVCYLRSADDGKYQGMMGQFIGVKGEVSTDPALGLKVVSATDVAPVDPNQLFRGVGSQIVPPSLLPQGGIAQQASGTE
jgi:uncharacterized protein YgiM (DUF1202 family)